MTALRYSRPLVRLTILTVLAVMSARCGKSSNPNQPSELGVSVASITMDATTVAPGGTARGTVTLSGTGTTAAIQVTLISTNPSAVTVPTSLTIPIGSTSANFSAVGVSNGSATIVATLDTSSRQSQMLTVSAQTAALRSITLAAPTVVGGLTIAATATLTSNAPAGGATIQLTSADPVSVPPTVTVSAGQASATFMVSTREVTAAVVSTITGVYAGATVSTTVSVTRPMDAVARFGVTGPSVTETCTLSDGGAKLNCLFDGSTSTAPGNITSWDWTFGVATASSLTTTSPVLTNPAFSCSLLPPAPLPTGVGFLSLTVTLVIHDDQGHVSGKATESGLRLLPQGACGY